MDDNGFATVFEELRIWQQARVLAADIYRSFPPNSPGAKDYGFKDQLQRAGVSVMNNIAEGFERRTPIEFARFLDMAKASCGEVRSMIYLAGDLGYISKQTCEEKIAFAIKLSKSIESLSKKLRARS